MKPVDPQALERLPGIRLRPGQRFEFRCHPAIGCFNRCCRNLNLHLYPYDVLRLKNRLAVSSDEFLDRFVDVIERPGNHFPDVLLRMADNAERTCPFLEEAGCTAYPDRPHACRTFPLEYGLLYDAPSDTETDVYLFRPPAFCLGQHEPHPWTVPDWMADQQAGEHHAMALQWARLRRLFLQDPWGPEGLTGPRARMAFMATYNLDRFRQFVFDSSFLKRFRLAPGLKRRVAGDDAALLELGFDWVRFYLWGLTSRRFKPR